MSNPQTARQEIIKQLAFEIALETNADNADHKKRLLDDSRVKRIEVLLGLFAKNIAANLGINYLG